MNLRKKVGDGVHVNTGGGGIEGGSGRTDSGGSGGKGPGSSGKPPPGGRPLRAPRGRTANGDAIAAPNPNANRVDYGDQKHQNPEQAYKNEQAAKRASALAHPTKALARIKAGTSKLDMVQKAQPQRGPLADPDNANGNPRAQAHLARFTARLEHKVERHAAVVARQAARRTARLSSR